MQRCRCCSGVVVPLSVGYEFVDTHLCHSRQWTRITLAMLFRPVSPWTEARLHSRPIWSSTDSTGSPRRLRRVPPSPGVVEVRSVDRAEMQLVRQASTTAAAAAASRTAPGSLETVSPRRSASPQSVVEPPATTLHGARPHAESSPANSRRERYGIATIMSRGTPPAVATPSTSVATQSTETTQARAAADNSFDSVPTDYDVSDTSRSRSGEPVTTTSMDSSSSATGPRPTWTGSGCSSVVLDRKWLRQRRPRRPDRDQHEPEVVAAASS